MRLATVFGHRKKPVPRSQHTMMPDDDDGDDDDNDDQQQHELKSLHDFFSDDTNRLYSPKRGAKEGEWQGGEL